VRLMPRSKLLTDRGETPAAAASSSWVSFAPVRSRRSSPAKESAGCWVTIVAPPTRPVRRDYRRRAEPVLPPTLRRPSHSHYFPATSSLPHPWHREQALPASAAEGESNGPPGSVPTRRSQSAEQPTGRHNRRICAQTARQSMQSAQANSRRSARHRARNRVTARSKRWPAQARKSPPFWADIRWNPVKARAAPIWVIGARDTVGCGPRGKPRLPRNDWLASSALRAFRGQGDRGGWRRRVR